MKRIDQLILDEPFRSLWAGQDAFAAVRALDGTILRDKEGRRTLRFQLGAATYYLKWHRGVGWGEIAKNLITARRPILGAEAEWRAIARLHTLGIDTMKALAFGQRGDNPARRESFLITAALAPTISLEDFCRDWPSRPPPIRLKRALIARVAEMTGALHRGGVNHRDCYLCHFLLHSDPPPTAQQLRLSLIDLHRAQLHAGEVPRRWRDKDLAALYFSASRIGLTRRDRLRFLHAYFRRPLRRILTEEARLLRHLEREVARLAARYQRKFAHEDAP